MGQSLVAITTPPVPHTTKPARMSASVVPEPGEWAGHGGPDQAIQRPPAVMRTPATVKNTRSASDIPGSVKFTVRTLSL